MRGKLSALRITPNWIEASWLVLFIQFDINYFQIFDIISLKFVVCYYFIY